ncbi:uncharacterized protein LOC133036884 [Cannabis sativa]|uniref:uncharacterized protein LOC133036884 n=1 Tax=Cannabis sativa TaxID=3483 RepID=UPI0029CAA424|nr:uncharacterized protein LOC133036884 [Cannabis sativa]
MRKRRIENRITTFMKGDTIVDKFKEAVKHFVKHFETFMDNKSNPSIRIDNDCIKKGYCLNLNQQVNLIRPFNKSDIKKDMMRIHPSKSPRLDGFSSGFYRDMWIKIGDEISNAVLGVFTNGRLPKHFNETVISLIPKIANPTSARDYRLIACCNAIYKCISKLICSRLSEVLPNIIQNNQDLLKGYTRKNISARCIMKIGLSKAYDTIDWQFVKDLLRIQGNFKRKKGLRQGDPMSLLLFVVIMEYLTRLCNKVAEKKGFGYHPMCQAQLIHSVLLGIRNFWMSTFIIPSKVVAAIDKSCRDFLWGTKGNKSKLHRASWEKVCLPKNLGGVGFREGKKWIKALIAKFLWALSHKQDCLWVKWINSIHLKGMDIWNFPKNRDTSWYFKKVLNLWDSTNETMLRLAVTGTNLRAKKFYNLLLEMPKVCEEVNSWLGVYHWPSLIADLNSRSIIKVKDLQNQVLNMVTAATLYEL